MPNIQSVICEKKLKNKNNKIIPKLYNNNKRRRIYIIINDFHVYHNDL